MGDSENKEVLQNEAVAENKQADNAVDIAHRERAPLPFMSALVDDCIGRGKTVMEGGAIYNFTGPQAFGNVDTGDAIYCIKKHVFEDKDLTMLWNITSVLNLVLDVTMDHS